MGFKEYLAVMRRSWWAIVVLAIVGGLSGFALSATATPLYSARSSVYFSLTFGASANDLNQGSNYTQGQMQSFALLAASPVVLDQVVDDLDLAVTAAQLAGSISVTTPQDTVILDISASALNPTRAADIANSVAEYLGDEVERNAPVNELGDASITTRVIADAQPPGSPSSPNTRLNLIAGVLVGLVAGVLLALLRHAVKNKVTNARELARTSSLPLLGSFERNDLLSSGHLLILHEPSAPLAESFRQLRANMQFVGVDSHGISVMITSSLPSEGKTVIASNLALATAEAEATVVLVDIDLRRPQVANYFGLEGSVGLSTVLAGRATLDDVIQSGGHPNLDVLVSGSSPPNPAVMLSSRVLLTVLADLKTRYDVVIVDSAPVLAAADAPSVALAVDGVVVVVDSTKTRRHQLKETIENLSSSGAAIFGFILNRLPRSRGRYAYYGPGTKPSDTDGEAGSSGQARP